MSDTAKQEFHLAEPALVCRWRLAGRHVPLLNRHMRALSQRSVAGKPLTTNMLGWVKQHIEWSLAEDVTVAADGVLMLVVDVEGQAAMSSGAYEPLADTSAVALAARAWEARDEAAETGVAPEVLCAMRAGTLTIGAPAGEHLCGAMTFVRQLAETKGLAVVYEPDLGRLASGCAGVPFLVSDEHGVVGSLPSASRGASDACSAQEGVSATEVPSCRPVDADASEDMDSRGDASSDTAYIAFFGDAFETLRDRAR